MSDKLQELEAECPACGNYIKWALKLLSIIKVPLSSDTLMAEPTEKSSLTETIGWARKHIETIPDGVEVTPRLRVLIKAAEQSAEKDRQIQALRRQLDAAGKELETEKEKRREAYKEAIKETEEAEKLRSQLAEKERKLKWLRGMLDRLLEQSDPPEIPAPTEGKQ